MTEKQKQLLVKALCGYLPYGLKICKVKPSFLKEDGLHIQDAQGIDLVLTIVLTNTFARVEDMKPYLRPMSSMTKEEQLELVELGENFVLCGEEQVHCASLTIDQIDWLNEHHFDYRGLIGMGLALEAEEGMYGSKE